LPVGNAGNISAYWLGFTEYFNDDISTKNPKMWGFQAAGAAPFIAGHPIENPETIATAIRIGNPASWDFAVAARDDSGGLIDSVTDEQILQAYHLLAEREGFFVEPASAASVAGLLQQAERGLVPAGAKIVCTVTGNGLKDTQWALKDAKDPVIVPVDVHRAADALGLA
jgi:threonine synthase